jgi:hypothetical protein
MVFVGEEKVGVFSNKKQLLVFFLLKTPTFSSPTKTITPLAKY